MREQGPRRGRRLMAGQAGGMLEWQRYSECKQSPRRCLTVLSQLAAVDGKLYLSQKTRQLMREQVPSARTGWEQRCCIVRARAPARGIASRLQRNEIAGAERREAQGETRALPCINTWNVATVWQARAEAPAPSDHGVKV